MHHPASSQAPTPAETLDGKSRAVDVDLSRAAAHLSTTWTCFRRGDQVRLVVVRPTSAALIAHLVREGYREDYTVTVDADGQSMRYPVPTPRESTAGTT